MEEYIKNLINVNKEATKNIAALESTIQNITVTTEKENSKTEFVCFSLLYLFSNC